MADRAEFLESIRHRVGGYKPTHAPDVAWTPKEGRRESAPIEDPAARFLEELEALRGHGERVKNMDEAREYVLALARERSAKLLVRWDAEELEELAVDEPLKAADLRSGRAGEQGSAHGHGGRREVCRDGQSTGQRLLPHRAKPLGGHRDDAHHRGARTRRRARRPGGLGGSRALTP